MLPIVLVLLVATSALAAPSVQLTQGSINDIAPAKSNGRLVGGYLSDRAFELVDGGDTNVYILTSQQIINDLANQNSPFSQALAVGQTLAILSQLATGIPGDSCAAAALINAEASGNPGAIRSALSNFAQSLSVGIDQIVQLSSNPNGVRYATGVQGKCGGGGRTYNFEGAWSAILSSPASPAELSLLNESYCAAKRLYGAFNARSNNVGAYITAASLPSFNRLIQEIIGPLANFLSAAANGNAGAAAGQAKQSLARAGNYGLI
ncbi:fibroin light chain-like [Anticarsia gemmatalis]|uniref:fibroin light chain-like n=1 Tax=Anticarsia gemmatalis TaxID=129554 RepID=UPI003F75AB59